ncbi:MULTISPECIES: DUF6644 family protein [Catenuloplanes]|uniref:DUF6644 domain-containing protein n=1 Tax=Catenuloplanes niger TaxID=587534 RepID=A0AAE4CY03_9ACTN|nr:DUF6644 family protein [Catenuloplanes niger]MDR7327148.1 hypothetical protein [Catenuloplanes niger]
MNSFLSWLEGGPVTEAIRGTPYLYPVLGSLHILGIALLVGPTAAFDLRLLGLGKRNLPVTTVAGFLLPLSRLGLVIAVCTGVLMFLPGASVVVERGSAPWKLGLLLIAGANVLVFHRRTYRTVSDWDLGESPPAPARAAAVVSVTSWAGVTVAGSLLAYT